MLWGKLQRAGRLAMGEGLAGASAGKAKAGQGNGGLYLQNPST